MKPTAQTPKSPKPPINPEHETLRSITLSRLNPKPTVKGQDALAEAQKARGLQLLSVIVGSSEYGLRFRVQGLV